MTMLPKPWDPRQMKVYLGLYVAAIHLLTQQSMTTCLIIICLNELKHNGFLPQLIYIIYICKYQQDVTWVHVHVQCITLHSRKLFTYVHTYTCTVDMYVLKCEYFCQTYHDRHSCRHVSWNMLVYFSRKTASSVQLASHIICTRVRRN